MSADGGTKAYSDPQPMSVSMTSYAADARTNAADADTTDARTNASDTSDPANATDASDATYTTGNTALPAAPAAAAAAPPTPPATPPATAREIPLTVNAAIQRPVRMTAILVPP